MKDITKSPSLKSLKDLREIATIELESVIVKTKIKKFAPSSIRPVRSIKKVRSLRPHFTK